MLISKIKDVGSNPTFPDCFYIIIMFIIKDTKLDLFICEFEEGEKEEDLEAIPEYSFWKPMPITSYINFIFESGNAETGPAITPTLAQYLMSPTELTTRADRECREVGLEKGFFIPFKYALRNTKYACIMEGPELNTFITEVTLFLEDFVIEIIKEYFDQIFLTDVIYSCSHFLQHHFLFLVSGKISFYKLHLYIIFLIQNRYSGLPMKDFVNRVRTNLLPFFTKRGTRRKYV
jgi:hypothetical protein